MSDAFELLKEYALLTEERAWVKDRLKVIEGKIAELMPRALAVFEEQGVSSIKVGDRTIYTARAATFPKKLDARMTADDIANELIERGFGDYAHPRVNWSGLGAFFRERQEAGERAVPAELVGLFSFEEKWEVRSRKA